MHSKYFIHTTRKFTDTKKRVICAILVDPRIFISDIDVMYFFSLGFISLLVQTRSACSSTVYSMSWIKGFYDFQGVKKL